MKPKCQLDSRCRVLAVFLTALCSLLFAAVGHAQWRETSYTLKGGWNAINVQGDASFQAIEAHFPTGGPGTVIEEIWRWNPNPNQVQFMTSSLIPATGTPEWSVWRRNVSANTLGQLTQGTYLVKCTGASTTTHPAVTLKMEARLPDNSWVRNGANLFGFPTSNGAGSYPLFSNYFASFPTAIATGTKIYKYVGGELGTTNPLQIFSPTAERVDATQAYWFSAETVGTFSAPLEVSLSTGAAIDFGRTSAEIVMRLTNTTSAALNVNLFTEASADYPTGHGSRASATNSAGLPTGAVPLTLRTRDGSGVLTESLISSTLTQEVAAKSTVELRFGIQRAAMTAATSDTPYSHCLRIKDAPSAALFDIWVPVKALKTDYSGLWLGEALVSAVESKPQENAVKAVSRPFPLRYLVHVDSAGAARVLSQVFAGRLASGGNPAGLCTKESGLLATDLKNARRLSAAHLPLDTVAACTGTFAVPSTLTASFSLPQTDPTNPFVHKYHPDHRVDSSYAVTRNVSLRFTVVPPADLNLFTMASGSTSTFSVGGSVVFYDGPATQLFVAVITEIVGERQFRVDKEVPRGADIRAHVFSAGQGFPAAIGSTSVPGWGSSVIGGVYSEAIQGIHRDTTANGGDGLKVEGTFELRRVSELGSLTINP